MLICWNSFDFIPWGLMQLHDSEPFPSPLSVINLTSYVIKYRIVVWTSILWDLNTCMQLYIEQHPFDLHLSWNKLKLYMCHQFNVGGSWCGNHFCSYIFHLSIYITNGSCTCLTEGLRFNLFYCNENLSSSTFIQGQIPGRSCKRRTNFVHNVSVNMQSCECWSGHI